MPYDKLESIHIGEVTVTGEPSTLAVHGLGSCVALILFDRVKKAGGLAHILLPGPRLEGDGMTDLPAKYGDEALSWMVEAFRERGSEDRKSVV